MPCERCSRVTVSGKESAVDTAQRPPAPGLSLGDYSTPSVFPRPPGQRFFSRQVGETSLRGGTVSNLCLARIVAATTHVHLPRLRLLRLRRRLVEQNKMSSGSASEGAMGSEYVGIGT